ncbi:sure-like protein [Dichomitus squalens]|uniref:Sure-like protein n=1 Tax=Dichomitus squalens TaxID=114155 RepID=A0A4Q9NEK0_9APHY|nr:sure-like protein [Dichomitus squalens]TBU38845.1 sure-like protein [Dichomitus squalens]
MRSLALSFTLLSAYAAATNIVISNDDGWATAQIRQQYDVLTGAGHSVILSAPALNQSGKGSLSKTPSPLTEPCEFDSCPAGSPATGSNATNSRLNYVNGYPVDAARFGIQTLAPQLHGAPPDFVVSGPNIGSNLGLVVLFSGTVGAACEAARSGIPAAAFSGVSGSQVSYTTLDSDPRGASTLAAQIYSNLTADFVQAVTSTPGAFLPPGVIANVNYAAIDSCPTSSSYKWVFSRLVWDPLQTDAATCGTQHLPSESSVVDAGCYASVSVISSSSKLDVNATLQSQVFDRLQSLPVTCLD